jgi:hypothetical protein
VRELISAHHWAGYPKKNEQKEKDDTQHGFKKNIFFSTYIMDAGIHNQQRYWPLWPAFI